MFLDNSCVAAPLQLQIMAKLVVLKAGPKYEVMATNKLPEPIDASPVAVGKQLYLRGSKNLYCMESR